MGNLRNLDNLEDLGADGTILTRIGVERIYLAHGKDHRCEGCNISGPTKEQNFSDENITVSIAQNTEQWPATVNTAADLR